MFSDFLFFLRAVGLKASLNEWLSVIRALSEGHAQANLNIFYNVTRSLVVKRESQFDLYDRAFAEFFKDVPGHFQLDDQLLEWLSNPKLPRQLSEEELAALKAMDLDELRKSFEERRKEQNERHDGGSHWIGTGGTSPFGHGGTHPAGVRVGGVGGGRSAIQIAQERRFKNLRSDQVLETRQMGVALRKLRRLSRQDGPSELDLQASIDKTARDGGEIDLVFSPPRSNKTKLLLLMDVGGSMDPYSFLSERLFSAAPAASHFKAFESYFFHNCIYEHVYTDMERYQGIRTDELLKRLDATWSVIVVGDAWMSPFELTHAGGSIYYGHQNAEPGLVWLKRLKDRCPDTVWLNPEPPRVWESDSIFMVRQVFPMFPFTLDGLSDAISSLKGLR